MECCARTSTFPRPLVVFLVTLVTGCNIYWICGTFFEFIYSLFMFWLRNKTDVCIVLLWSLFQQMWGNKYQCNVLQLALFMRLCTDINAMAVDHQYWTVYELFSDARVCKASVPYSIYGGASSIEPMNNSSMQHWLRCLVVSLWLEVSCIHMTAMQFSSQRCCAN